MLPAVPPPKGLIRRSVDFKLKPGWRYDEREGVFVDARGGRFEPPSLPKKARILHKVPALARSSRRSLSGPQRELQRYMHVILPPGAPQRYEKMVEAWPCVEEAHVAPEVSLPGAGSSGGQTARRKPKRR